MKTPHIHAELIKAWADGATVQCFSTSKLQWEDITHPNWLEFCEYRIKPEPLVLKGFVCTGYPTANWTFTADKLPGIKQQKATLTIYPDE